jgi:hypothetical protein
MTKKVNESFTIIRYSKENEEMMNQLIKVGSSL